MFVGAHARQFSWCRHKCNGCPFRYWTHDVCNLHPTIFNLQHACRYQVAFELYHTFMVAVVFKCIVCINILTSKFSQVCSIHVHVFEGFVKACVLHSSLSSVLYMIVVYRIWVSRTANQYLQCGLRGYRNLVILNLVCLASLHVL